MQYKKAPSSICIPKGASARFHLIFHSLLITQQHGNASKLLLLSRAAQEWSSYSIPINRFHHTRLSLNDLAALLFPSLLFILKISDFILPRLFLIYNSFCKFIFYFGYFHNFHNSNHNFPCHSNWNPFCYRPCSEQHQLHSHPLYPSQTSSVPMSSSL